MRAALAGLGVVALVAAGCSGSGDAQTEPAPTITTLGTAPTTTAAVATTTTTMPDATPTTTPTTPEDATQEIAGDGVTVTDDTIYVGILADLSGPFSGNVIDLVDGQLAFWADLNERGGIAGRQVEVLIADTGYDLEAHQTLYNDMVDNVVMFTHSTGSPHTAAIADDLVRDDRLAIPVGWYSGWSDPTLGANLLELGSNYCLEAANAVSFLAATHEAEFGELPAIALATDQGDYGQDSAAGAKLAADELGLELVFDGEATIGFGADPTEVGQGIAESGADYTWVATDPSTAAELVTQALTAGYAGAWSGATPSFSPRFLGTALGEYVSDAWLVSVFFAPAGADVKGMNRVYGVLAEAFPDRYPSDGLVRGYLEFALAAQLLEKAAELGDLTPAGVVAASAALGEVDFGGISPGNVYGGDFNDAVARTTGLYRASKERYDEQGGVTAVFADGAVSPFEPIEPAYVSDVAAELDFTEPCWTFADS